MRTAAGLAASHLWNTPTFSSENWVSHSQLHCWKSPRGCILSNQGMQLDRCYLFMHPYPSHGLFSNTSLYQLPSSSLPCPLTRLPGSPRQQQAAGRWAVQPWKRLQLEQQSGAQEEREEGRTAVPDTDIHWPEAGEGGSYKWMHKQDLTV